MASKGKMKEKQVERSLTRFYVILGSVGVIGIGALGYTVGTNLVGGAVVEPVELEGVEDPEALISMARGVEHGDPQAPVRILEFSDYQCPGCARFASEIKTLLTVNYIETGKVLFVYYDFPIVAAHKHAFLAARAARCAGEQGEYWAYHDHLFGQQPRWSAKANATDEFVDYAEAVGLDRKAFEGCLKSERYADVVTANLRLGEQLGVSGTPTLYIDGKLIRGLSGYEQLREVIEAELGM